MLRWLCYILAIIVSVQAFAAAADVHQAHQPEKEHLELYEHKAIDSEQSSQNPNDQLPNNSAANAFDCHHHCHSCHTHVLVRDSLATQSLSYDLEPTGYVNPAQSGILSQPYRPPRV